MIISEFIEQLTGLYESEGDLEIRLLPDSDSLGVEPKVRKDPFGFDKYEITPW